MLGGHWADVEAELAQLAAPARSSSNIRSRLCITTCLATEGPKLLFVADSVEKLLLGMRGVWLRHVGVEDERQAHLQSALLGAEARGNNMEPDARSLARDFFRTKPGSGSSVWVRTRDNGQSSLTSQSTGRLRHRETSRTRAGWRPAPVGSDGSDGQQPADASTTAGHGAKDHTSERSRGSRSGALKSAARRAALADVPSSLGLLGAVFPAQSFWLPRPRLQVRAGASSAVRRFRLRRLC